MSGGRALVRAALRARNRSPAFISNLKSEIPGLTAGAIEAFINGGELPREQTAALIRSLWGGLIVLDMEADVLRSSNTQPATLMAAAHPATDAVNAPAAILGRTSGQTYPPPLFARQGPPKPSLRKKIGWG